MIDQHPEDPTPARQVADRPVRLGVDAARDEPGQLPPVVVQDPERGVLRAGQLARDIEQPVQHLLEAQLGDQGAAHVDQQAQTLRFQLLDRMERHGTYCARRSPQGAHR